MFESVDELEVGLGRLAAGIDTALITADFAHQALVRLARLTKLAQAAVTVVAARAYEVDGVREPREAYAADALCALADQPANTKGSCRSGAEFIVRVDLAALFRGDVDAGEVFEIPGCGPVPVTTARRLLGDSLLNLVLHDGVDIRTVVCGGRKAAKALAIAIFERDPYCVDCGSAFRLEKDHDTPVALKGPTSYWNTKHRCPLCHDRKTRAEAHETIPAGRARAAKARQQADQADRAAVAAQQLLPTGTDPP